MVELMVGEILAVLLVIGLLTNLGPILTDFGRQNAVAQIQEIGRLATDQLSNAIMESGYQGCDPEVPWRSILDVEGSVVSPSLRNWAYDKFSLTGYNVSQQQGVRQLLGADWQRNRYRFRGEVVGDVILLQRGAGPELTLKDHNSADHQLEFVGNLSEWLEPGQILQLNDCDYAVRFQIDQQAPPSYLSDADITVVNYSSQQTINCDGAQFKKATNHRVSTGCAVDVESDSATDYRFEEGTRAHIVESAAYFIGFDADSGHPALKKTGFAGNASRVHTESVVEGIENMRLEFIVDNADGTSTNTFSAAEMDEHSVSWDKVIAVNLWLLIRSSQKTSLQSDQEHLLFPDETGNAIDCFAPDSLGSTTSITTGYYQACPFDIESRERRSRHVLQLVIPRYGTRS